MTFPTSSCPCLERHQNYLWDFLKGLDGRWGRSRSGKVDVWIRTRIWAYLSTVVVVFFCKSGLFQRQTYVQPIRGWFERGWRRRDSFVSLRCYNLLTPIVHFWRVSVACQASLVEPFVFWQDMVEPKCLPRDQTSLICRQSVREGCE